MLDRGIVRVSRKSLAYRLYQYWQTLGGQTKWGYRENLCHFGRVLIFWLPWMWFWYQPLIGGRLRPWMVGAAMLYIILAILFPGLIAFVTIGTIVIAAIIVLILVLEFGTRGAREKIGDCLDDLNFRAYQWFAFTYRPWWERSRARKVWNWFWTARFGPLVYPWSIALLIFQVSSIFWRPAIFRMLSVLELVIAIVFVLVYAYFYIQVERRLLSVAAGYISGGTATVTRPVVEPVVGTVGVVTSWLAALKGKICPFIEFVD